MELGDGIMGSYGVDSVLFDDELRNIPKAMMMAANDPVGAWGDREVAGRPRLDANIDHGTGYRQRLWEPSHSRPHRGARYQ